MRIKEHDQIQFWHLGCWTWVSIGTMAPQEAQGTRQLTEPLPPPMPTGSSFCSPSGTTSASAHSTSALRGLPAYQPDLSNILSIKSKREGSLRGGDEKVFVFYSGTIFSLRHFFYETFVGYLCPYPPQQFFSHRAQTPKRRQKLLAMLPYNFIASRVGLDAPAKLALWQKDAFWTGFQLATIGEKWGAPGAPSPWPLFFIGF